jgi:DUF1009 family protein
MTAGPNSTGPIGLLAGSGRFPVLFAEKAHSLGMRVVCVGIKHEAPPQLQQRVHRFHWAGISKIGRMIRLFKREGVQRIVMAGKITKSVIYTPWRVIRLWPDWRTIRFWLRRTLRDNKDDSLLLDLIDEFRRDGMDFDSALTYVPELLVSEGQLTRRPPTALERVDIAFGWQLAREMGRLDVGQSVVVKEKAVLAVEAIEGTDRAILRAGDLCRSGGFTVVKVAKPQQDMRFDVPTVGPSTIESMVKARGRVLAVEAGKTILIDQNDTIALANKHGISLVALTDASAITFQPPTRISA